MRFLSGIGKNRIKSDDHLQVALDPIQRGELCLEVQHRLRGRSTRSLWVARGRGDSCDGRGRPRRPGQSSRHGQSDLSSTSRSGWRAEIPIQLVLRRSHRCSAKGLRSCRSRSSAAAGAALEVVCGAVRDDRRLPCWRSWRCGVSSECLLHNFTYTSFVILSSVDKEGLPSRAWRGVPASSRVCWRRRGAPTGKDRGCRVGARAVRSLRGRTRLRDAERWATPLPGVGDLCGCVLFRVGAVDSATWYRWPRYRGW